MRGASNWFRHYRYHWLRCVTTGLGLIALAMQAVAGYLPMPAIGGLTSWQLAWQQPCPEHETGGDRTAPAKPSPHHSCSVCVVMQQAGSSLAPADVMPLLGHAVRPIEHGELSDLQTAGLRSQAFSSRAPPRIG